MRKPSLGEVLAATGGVQELQGRIDELRRRFQQNTGWRPGAFVSQFLRRWTERLDSVDAHLRAYIRPSYAEEPSMSEEEEIRMLEKRLEELKRRRARVDEERGRGHADLSVEGVI